MPKKTPTPSVAHSVTRSHHANETAEDYVEAVHDILADKEECRVNHLAKFFGVSHVTVSRIVSRLQNEGYLETAPYKPITLTRKGKQLAVKMKQRHAIVMEFLLALGVDEKTARVDSEGIEHHVSPETLKAMKKFIDKSNRP